MPSTVNGIGTGYWGKKRLYAYQGRCRSCGRQTTLTCYDTNLCFVVLFLPVIPLGKKRIIDYCGACTRHYAMPFSEWQVASSRASSSADAYRAKPTDRALAEEAVAARIGLRDYSGFLELAPEIEKNLASDPKALGMVAGGYEFFNHLPDAERALKAALAAKDEDEISEALADNLMRQNRPAEAETFVQHIIQKGIPDRVDSLYQLAQAFARKGDHAKALEYFQHSETVFPQVANDKTFQKLKAQSEKLLGTNTAVDSGKLLQRERTAAGWKKFGKIAAVVLLLGSIAYLVLAFFQGRYREVFIANGTDRPYNVRLNGAQHLARSRDVTRVRVAEGDIKLEVLDAPFPIPDETVSIRTSFWTRPFNSHVFVINPDHSALLSRTRVTYTKSAIPGVKGPPPVHNYLVGKTLFDVEGVDYQFENAPDSVSTDSHNSQVEKYVLELVHNDNQVSPSVMLYSLAEKIGPDAVIEAAKRRLMFEPQRSDFINLLYAIMPRQDYIAFLRTGLGARPVLMPWHRLYQTAMENMGQKDQISKEYDALLAKEPDDKDLMYLAGRASSDIDKNIDLCTKASAGDKPCPYALHSLGGYYLESGDFAHALPLAQRAAALLPAEVDIRYYYKLALLGSAQYPKLMELVREDEGKPLPGSLGAYAEEVMLHNLMNKRADVDGAISRLRQALRGMEMQLIEQEAIRLTSIDNYCAGNPSYYATVLKTSQDPEDRLVADLALGSVVPAEAELAKMKPDAHVHLLMYLAAKSKSQSDIATKHLNAAIEQLAQGDSDDRAYAAAFRNQSKLPTKELLRLRQVPYQKLVLLTAMGLQNPTLRSECFAMARKLNFDRRFPYLLIKSVLDNPPR